MADAETKGKTKSMRREHCVHLKGPVCSKTGRACNCNKMFYTECTIFNGNYGLKRFF